MASSNTKEVPVSEDLAAQQISSNDFAELAVSTKDRAAKQFSSIVNDVTKISLESTKEKSPKPLSKIDQLNNTIRLLDKREEKPRENLLLLPNSTKFGLTQQTTDETYKRGKNLLYMEFQKLQKGQRINSKNQTKTTEKFYDIPEKELNKPTVDTLAEGTNE